MKNSVDWELPLYDKNGKEWELLHPYNPRAEYHTLKPVKGSEFNETVWLCSGGVYKKDDANFKHNFYVTNIRPVDKLTDEQLAKQLRVSAARFKSLFTELANRGYAIEDTEDGCEIEAILGEVRIFKEVSAIKEL
jgi:hypothetical protein